MKEDIMMMQKKSKRAVSLVGFKRLYFIMISFIELRI